MAAGAEAKRVAPLAAVAATEAASAAAAWGLKAAA